MGGILTWQLNTLKKVIPAKAGIQNCTGCRIKSGMTVFVYLIAGLIIRISISRPCGIDDISADPSSIVLTHPFHSINIKNT